MTNTLDTEATDIIHATVHEVAEMVFDALMIREGKTIDAPTARERAANIACMLMGTVVK